MRPDPGTPPDVPDASRQSAPGMIRQVRRYELITPLFGGGAQTKAADEVTTVRGSEIRGQLRFWWRATRGGQFGGDLQRMKAAEDALWGAPATKTGQGPSKVQIALGDISHSGEDIPFEVVPSRKDPNKPQLRPRAGSRAPDYAAFPLQPEQNKLRKDMKLPPVLTGVRFTLTLDHPDDEQSITEVEAALWAWETFGGIGGRTRRGFGALRRITVETKGDLPADATAPQRWLWEGYPLPNADSAKASLKQAIKDHVTPNGQWPDGVPHLLTRYEAVNRGNDSWKYLIGKLREFRQARTGGTQGRSEWPEPDAIRRVVGTWAPNHKPEHKVQDKYPRAAFGLPIVFKFKTPDERNGDPTKTTLEGAKHGRMASPLILKPLACAGGKTVGLAVIMQGTSFPPGGVKLKDAPGDPKVEVKLDQTKPTPEADLIEPLNGEPDVLTAFLNTL